MLKREGGITRVTIAMLLFANVAFGALAVRDARASSSESEACLDERCRCNAPKGEGAQCTRNWTVDYGECSSQTECTGAVE